jgi:hypothetical protein
MGKEVTMATSDIRVRHVDGWLMKDAEVVLPVDEVLRAIVAEKIEQLTAAYAARLAALEEEVARIVRVVECLVSAQDAALEVLRSMGGGRAEVPQRWPQ